MLRPELKSRTIHRIPGNHPSSNFEIELLWANSRDDPNEYYQVLDLDPNTLVTTADVLRAYRVAVKKYHPDGSAPDTERFEQVQLAYETLGNPELRRDYDTRDRTNPWIDRKKLQDILRDMRMELSRIDSLLAEQMVIDIKQAATRSDWVRTHRSVVSPGVAFYYYEGVSVPVESVRQGWLEQFATALWLYRIIREINIGFTDDAPHVSQRTWGEIFFVSGEPNPFTSVQLVGELCSLVAARA